MSKYTIEPDSRVPFFYGMPFSKYNTCSIQHKKISRSDCDPNFDNDKSVPHLKKTVYFLIFSAVQTSKTSFQIAEECTIKRLRFQNFPCNFNFRYIVQIAAECTIKKPFKKFLSSRGREGPLTPAIFLFRVNFILPTPLVTDKTVVAAKYP